MPRKPSTGIPGLSCKRGHYVYQPPMGAGRVRPPAIHLGTRDLTEAVLMAEQIRQRDFVDSRLDPLSVLVADYLAAKQASGEHRGQTTRHAATAGLNRFASYFRCAPSDIRPDRVREWRDSLLAEGLSRSSVQGYMRYAQSLCSWLVRERRLLVNPFIGQKGLFPKSVSTRRERACTREQRDRLLEHCECPHLRAVLHVGFLAGLRRQEILSIRPHWILLDRGGRPSHIHVQNDDTFTVKDGLAKKVPISGRLAECLLDYGLDHHPYLIRPEMRPGRHQYRWDWKRAWRTYMKSQHLPWVTPHTMRHTWFSLLLSAPTPPSMMRLVAWSGNSEAVILKNYGHLSESRDLIDVAD